MSDAVIVAAARSAIGKKKGSLAATRADELLAKILKGLVDRAKIDPAQLDDVVAGCVTQAGEQGYNIARTAALMAGFPVEVTGTSVNRQCGSSQQAFHFAAMAVMSGQLDAVIAAGVESMSRIPMGVDGSAGPAWPGAVPFSPMFASKYNFIPQHFSAEMVAEKWGIARAQCEEYSLASHQRAAQARETGRFRDEILPIEVALPDGTRRVF